MHNRTLFIFLLLNILPGIFLNKAYGQSEDISAELYKASTIPDSLKKDANAVVRYSNTDITIKAPGKVNIKRHSLVTILNEKAEDEAVLVLGYDKKFTSINNAELLAYDADGKLLKKYRKGDMYDRAALDGVSIITDDRILAIRHTIAKYPITIEEITEQTQNSYLGLDEWDIQRSEIAIQNSSYHVLAKPEVGFRYKNKNTLVAPVRSAQNGFDSYRWVVKNIKAIKLEENAISWKVFPKILFGTNSFEFGGIPGDISSWKNYGIWQQNLNADVCSLSPQRSDEIRAMVADLKTDKQKVEYLYNYLQHNMRYVSVQLGIGGLKPFPATFVDQKKYGDCKALSNYMTALLKAVNIPAYFSIVKAGANEQPADTDFPSDPFNHIIVCVPLKGDTTWLECTSTTQSFGKLGAFTENRNALLITEDGGKLVNTPKSTMADNQFNSEAHLILAPDGSAKAYLKILSTGEYRRLYIDMSEQKTDAQKEFLIHFLNIKQPSVFDLKPGGDKDGVKEVDVDMEYDRFCDIATGDKLFYHPRVFDLWGSTLPPLEKRTTDFYFEHPMQKTCITTIDLPQGFEIESMPANASLKFTYGNYAVNYVYDAAKNQIVSTTRFNLTHHVIPAAKYNEMQQYMDNIAKTQNKKLIIRKKA